MVTVMTINEMIEKLLTKIEIMIVVNIRNSNHH